MLGADLNSRFDVLQHGVRVSSRTCPGILTRDPSTVEVDIGTPKRPPPQAGDILRDLRS